MNNEIIYITDETPNGYSGTRIDQIMRNEYVYHRRHGETNQTQQKDRNTHTYVRVILQYKFPEMPPEEYSFPRNHSLPLGSGKVMVTDWSQ
jgi:hypothetical protein